ncbi:DeoR family transcriptional regulator [Spiroplasma endosymbiont of Glossina fuscipes fuscipes]|uniref:DeoR family transcriptional regulator n=1 Tax=Spiroplasma endosymbiont of Glossina fuscipes fuscipes TaxID=2004463 RepID=UPI003C71BA0A
MHRVQRKDLLLEYLCQKPFHEMNHVLEYVSKFNISATTARRDLKELENEGIITMSYGGINFLGVHNKSCSIDRASSINFDKKMIIVAKKILISQQIQLMKQGQFIKVMKKKPRLN